MGRLRVRGGFFLLMAVLFYLDEGVGILPRGLLACVLHEGGHYAAGRCFGGRLGWLELSAVGAQMGLTYSAALSYGREGAVALAGPAVNLAAGLLSLRAGWHLFGAVNLVLAGFNLLPILPLDGGRALWCALSSRFGADRAERALPVIGAVPVGILAGLGGVAAVRFANVSLLVTSLWLLWLTLGKKAGKRRKKCLHFEK